MDDIQSWWEVPSIAHFCSLFRAAFNLLDFDIEELEEALLTDGAEDTGSGLIQELIVRLLCGCLDKGSSNDVSTFNYQMFLRRLFRQKCQECGRDNPFNTDIDFQFLPLRTKVEILHALCDFRLDAEDVQDLLKNLDSDSLRVIPLGYDENSSAYWYFYGTRLYKENYTKVQKKKAKEKKRKGKEDRRKRKRGKSPPDSDEDELGTGLWQVVCFSEHDWDKLTQSFKGSTSKVEKALYRTLSEDFLPEIPRLFAEKERLQRKRLLEYQPRRQSSRLEKLKQQKVEEERLLREEEKLRLLEDESSKSSLTNAKEDRINRALWRSMSQTASECGSLRSFSDSQLDAHSNRSSTKAVGRQTNNSLASATGQIVIQGLRRKLRSSQVFKQSEEDLQTGMYKILDHIKNHKDAWPFIEPVEEEYAPRYYSIVSKPMDLQRMEDKLDEGEYLNFNDFKADFDLIVENCRKYNGTENEYTEMVGTLQEAFEQAVERYLDSDHSSDEEIAVEYPLLGDAQTEQPSVKHRARRKDGKEPTPSSPSLVSQDTVQSIDGDDKEIKEEKSETMGEMTDTEGSTTKDGADSSLRQSKSKSSTSSRQRKKSEVIKNAAAIEALELATEQTLKDINKWLDDTPRFSEFSSASNSPSHFINTDEFDAFGSKVEIDYKSRLKIERPLRKDGKDSLKRRPTNKDPSKLRRREPQRTIERLQPGKSKGNLISNMQTINAFKQAKEETSLGLKPKESRNSLVVKTDEMTPKLSLGTVLTSDVMAFNVGQTSHSFDTEMKEEKCKSLSDDESLETSPKVLPSHVSPEPVKTEPTVLKRKINEIEESKETSNKKIETGGTPNLNAWFKAFGAPKAPPAPVKRKEPSPQEEIENQRPILVVNQPSPVPVELSVKSVQNVNVIPSVRTGQDMHDVPVPAKADMEVLRKESPEDVDRLSQPRYEEASSPHHQGGVVRQRRVSTGSSMSERSSFSQDPSEPVDSSPRLTGLMLDERLGGYPSAPYPSPLHRSPIAPSPQMVSPRTDDVPKPPPYPPPNGTIRVGFYQEKSPEKSPQGHPPPIYQPAGYVPQSTPPSYDLYNTMPYYDTNKSLTDQYHAARTQAVTTSIHTYTPILQKPSATMFPVKKRLYSEVDSQQRAVQQVATPAERSPVSVNGMQSDAPSSDGPARSQPSYTQDTPENEHHTSRSHQLPAKVSHVEKLGEPPSTSTTSISLHQTSDRLQYTYPPVDPLHKTNITQSQLHHQSVSSMEMAQVGERVQQTATSIQGFQHQDRIQTAMATLRGGEMAYRGPFSPGPPVSLGMENPLGMRGGNLASLSHIVDRYSADDRVLQQQPYYGEKGIFGQGAPTTLQQSLTTSMFSQSPAVMTMAYNRDSPISFNRSVPELSSVLPNKVGNIQSPYNRNVSELSGMLPPKSVSPFDMQSVYNRSELSLLQNKVSSHSQPQYSRPLADLSLVPNKATPSIDVPSYNTSGTAAPSFNRAASDYSSQQPSKAAEPISKPSRKRKTKQVTATTTAASEAAGFQHYSSIKSAEQSPIALKTTSVVPGSAFNFGPAPSGLGLYGDKEGYAGYLDEYRPSSGYYMHTPEPSSDKVAQGSPSPFPFLSHPQPRAPTYPQLGQAFMNQTLMEASGYQYFQRQQEEFLRHSATPMVLHQGLLAPSTSYSPGYHPALGMRQPYDALNRPSWL